MSRRGWASINGVARGYRPPSVIDGRYQRGPVQRHVGRMRWERAMGIQRGGLKPNGTCPHCGVGTHGPVINQEKGTAGVLVPGAQVFVWLGPSTCVPARHFFMELVGSVEHRDRRREIGEHLFAYLGHYCHKAPGAAPLPPAVSGVPRCGTAGCHAPVAWMKNLVSGKTVPLDQRRACGVYVHSTGAMSLGTPVVLHERTWRGQLGRVILKPGAPWGLPLELAPDAFGFLVSHFSTCPAAAQHSKKGARK